MKLAFISFGAALGAALSLIPVTEAHATFPGTNGRIAFVTDRDGNREIYSMNPDGTGITRLTNDSRQDEDPAWSPDGKRIAFVRHGSLGPRVWVMNADGSDQQEITAASMGAASDPTWSPDGTRIAFAALTNGRHVTIVHDDGTSPQSLPGTAANEEEYDPAWSPDGGKIAYARRTCDPDPETCLGDPELWVAKLDGSGNSPLVATAGLANDEPDWFPNGQRIVFDRCFVDDFANLHCNLGYVNADGTGLAGGSLDSSTPVEPSASPDGLRVAYANAVGGNTDVYVDGTRVTNTAATDSGPSWQPVPIGYPRPKGATPVYASLVPAYDTCAAPNRTHGAPLAFGSCAPPAPQSPNLTVGTPDANGAGAAFTGAVTLGVRLGDLSTPADEADVRVTARLTDVRTATDLADYTGELQLQLPLRITDRDNTGAGPATVEDSTLAAGVPCSGTTGAVGATCASSTTLDAIVPGVVKEGRRSVWELGQIRVDDGGPDGVASTPDNAVFAVQGLFEP